MPECAYCHRPIPSAPCPTCGGKRDTWGETGLYDPCPDCVDGKVSIVVQSDLPYPEHETCSDVCSILERLTT